MGVTITSGIVNVMLFKNGCFLGEEATHFLEDGAQLRISVHFNCKTRFFSHHFVI